MENTVSVEFNAWWLLVVPTMLIITIVILTLIVKIPPLFKKDLKKKSLTSWIEVKDLLYWLLMICLGSISLFTYQYRENSEVIDHWGFAGTIISIILAVVAIGFTLFQTLSSNLSSEKIAVSADKIEQATLNLDSKTLSESSRIINEAADLLKSKIYIIEEKLDTINLAQETFSELAASNFGNKPIKNNNEDLDVLDLDIFIDEVLPELPYYSQLYIYSYLLFLNEGVSLEEEEENLFDDISFSVSKYDLENNIQPPSSEDFLEGANYGSHSATRSFFNSLGLTEKFCKLDGSVKQEVINKSERFVKEYHSTLVVNLLKTHKTT